MREIVGWEAEWARYRDLPEDRVERDRRYGLDFSVEQSDGGVHVMLQLPTKVPAVRDRFRFGAPEVMPEYKTHVYLNGGKLFITAWVPRISASDKKDVKLVKAQILALAHTSSSFPGRFTTELEIPGDPIVGFT